MSESAVSASFSSVLKVCKINMGFLRDGAAICYQ